MQSDLSKTVATRRAASLSGLRAFHLWSPYGFYKRRSAYMTMRESPRGMEASIGCAAGDGMGGGIFALRRPESDAARRVVIKTGRPHRYEA